jgi:hypothetical protein
MTNFIKTADFESVDNFFKTHQDKLIIQLYYNEYGNCSRSALKKFSELSSCHPASYFMAIRESMETTDNASFINNKYYINYINDSTMTPHIKCYYLGKSVGKTEKTISSSSAETIEEEVEKFVWDAEKFVALREKNDVVISEPIIANSDPVISEPIIANSVISKPAMIAEKITIALIPKTQLAYEKPSTSIFDIWNNKYGYISLADPFAISLEDGFAVSMGGNSYKVVANFNNCVSKRKEENATIKIIIPTGTIIIKSGLSVTLAKPLTVILLNNTKIKLFAQTKLEQTDSMVKLIISQDCNAIFRC